MLNNSREKEYGKKKEKKNQRKMMLFNL